MEKSGVSFLEKESEEEAIKLNIRFYLGIKSLLYFSQNGKTFLINENFQSPKLLFEKSKPLSLSKVRISLLSINELLIIKI